MLSEKKMLAYRDLAPGAYQAFPFIGIVSELAGEQDLEPPMKKFARCRISGADGLRFKTFAVAIKTRWKHPCVVENDEIARPEKIGKVDELAIDERPV